MYEEPLAPTVAARRLGQRLEPAAVEQATRAALAWWSERADVIVVEGLGGLLSPLAEKMTVADLAIRLDYPLVIVARRGLGTLNHTLLTIEAAWRRGLRVAGIVLNSPLPAADANLALAEATNADELVRWLDLAIDRDGIAVLAEVPFHGGADAPGLDDDLGSLDWSHRALLPRWGLTRAPDENENEDENQDHDRSGNQRRQARSESRDEQ
jgi:dethiobiotin synthetase